MKRFMTKVKSHSACDPRVICARDKIRNFIRIIIMETLFVFEYSFVNLAAYRQFTNAA